LQKDISNPETANSSSSEFSNNSSNEEEIENPKDYISFCMCWNPPEITSYSITSHFLFSCLQTK
jgi:hypothetical protein